MLEASSASSSAARCRRPRAKASGRALLGFVLVLVVDAFALMLAADALPDHIQVNSFGDTLLAALAIAAVSIVLQVLSAAPRRTAWRRELNVAQPLPSLVASGAQ